jgi:uncharacterized lipoprotein YajG
MAVGTRMIRDSLIVVALGASLAGCLGPVPISLPSLPATPLPEQGRSVSVTVTDERSEKSPARVGTIPAAGRDFVLEGDSSLAARLEDELVSALRTRGYRADHAGKVHLESGLSVVVRVVRFVADVQSFKKVRFQGRSVLVAHATASQTPDAVWSEVIDTREDVALGDFARLDATRKLVEQFVQKAAAALADRVSVGLPSPSGGGS